MLVLTRKSGEGIAIGDDITIKIVELKGGTVRIGIDAPKNRKIYRQEVYNQISQENKAALNWNISDLDALTANLSTAKEKNENNTNQIR